MRKVFVLENGGAQKKLSFEIDENEVKTLGDLIPMIQQNGISTQDKVFYESKSRSQLIDNESVLPANTEDNGKLIIMVTNAQKKISNGVVFAPGTKRPEINDYIRRNGLATEINEYFGKNWTNVPSADLINYINKGVENTETCTACAVYDAAVSYVEDCEDDVVRAYLLDLLGASNKEENELNSMNVEDLFPWVK